MKSVETELTITQDDGLSVEVKEKKKKKRVKATQVEGTTSE